MEEYIKKSALVAEITRKIKVLEAFVKNFDGISDKVEKAKNKIEALGDMLLFIESLEVKEVDLEANSFDATVCKICNTYLKEMDKDAIVKALEPYKDGDKVKVIIKAQKGE